MIEYTSGDLLQDESEAIVNTVNCVGVMGRGIALQFKKAWPENFKAYEAACKREEVKLGRMFVFETRSLTPPRYIVNFPTKRDWRGDSRIQDIEAGLADLVNLLRERKIRSIALPPLGSGLGRLDWTEVRARIEAALVELPDIHVRVYEPNGAPLAAAMQPARTVPEMTPGRAALVELMRRYLAGLLDPFVSLLEVHKLMYFLQFAGEPLALEFKTAPYGPYAENLRHVLNKIEGHLISGYADGGDAPEKSLQLMSGAAEQAGAFLRSHAATQFRLGRVSKLVEGFESSFGLELLATVHWIFVQEGPLLQGGDVVERVYSWNVRKRQFSPRQIGIAVAVLMEQGWIGTPQAESP